MDGDPIVDTPAKRRRVEGGYNSEDDSGDELFADYDNTIATLPLTHPVNLAATGQASPYFASPAPAITQPTQILDTPVRHRTDSNAVVQVPASSPTQQSQRPGSSPLSRNARPGASRSQSGANPHPQRIPMASAGSFSDESPTNDTSEDELAVLQSKSDIKPSAFVSKKAKPHYPAPRNAPPSIWQSFLNNIGNDTQGTTKRPGDETANAHAPAVKKSRPLSNPQKRSGDDMANAYAPQAKKPRPAPPQTGPSRAMPVDDITLKDIPDYLMSRKVERMAVVYPDKSVSLLYKALQDKRGSYDDALSYVCELEEANEAKEKAAVETVDLTADDDVSPVKKISTATALAAKRSSNQASKIKAKSIQEKWSAPQVIHEISDESNGETNGADPSPVKPRRRLVRKSAVTSPTPEPPTPQKPAPANRKKPITLDSDGESEAEITEEEVDEEAAQEIADTLLGYINQCSAQDLVDLSEKTLEECEGVLAKRPFKSLDAVRRVDTSPAPLTKTGKPRKNHRTTGDKVVDMAENMWAGYTSVDQLVAQCQEIGEPIFADMKRLGFHTSGAKANGELNLTSMDEAKNDSGIGTPSSSLPTDDEDDDVVSRKVRALQKPSIMSKDLVLKDYQVVGLNWLSILWKHKVSAILADDMGLGKTCQVISFLSWLYETGEKGVHVVIVPSSTLENWLREFQNFSPKLAVRPYFASAPEKPWVRQDLLSQIDKINVIVTTYDQASGEDDNKFLRKLNPTVCVYDEGHMLKNSKSKRYQQMMRIPAKFRLLLSGTPVQNNLQELASILSFLMPDIFAEHAENLQYIFRKKAKTNEDNHASLLSAQRIDRARTMMAPFILRRKKQQVLGKHLPKKTCRVEYCEMIPDQKEIYDSLMAVQEQILLDRAEGKKNTDNANVTIQLRLAAVHTMLSRRFFDDEKVERMARDFVRAFPKDKKSYESKLDEYLWANDVHLAVEVEKYPDVFGTYAEVPDDLWFQSGKIEKVVELVQEWAQKGDRTLLFSQWVKTLDILEHVLSVVGIPYLRMDGETATAERQDLIDQFYHDAGIKVFMLSTKTGGTGINLACANKVLIFDEQYNPQEDIQAENRAHRVGQTREVEVVRLVTRGTIEEKIHALGESKLAMDERVAGGGGGGGDAGDDGGPGAKKKSEAAGVGEIEKQMLEELKASGRLEQLKKERSCDLKEGYKGMLEQAGVKMAE